MQFSTAIYEKLFKIHEIIERHKQRITKEFLVIPIIMENLPLMR